MTITQRNQLAQRRIARAFASDMVRNRDDKSASVDAAFLGFCGALIVLFVGAICVVTGVL